ncbi:MAG: hypothetical protein QF675_09735, partial [SAR324 cluster bacterium]|nr:hypothetical protein [SAR324 cluster bacterium]
VIGTGQNGICTLAETARRAEPAIAKTILAQMDSSILGKTVAARFGYMIHSGKDKYLQNYYFRF